jgi:hypothetical protein
MGYGKNITPASLIGSYYIQSHKNYLAYRFHLKIPTFVRMVKKFVRFFQCSVPVSASNALFERQAFVYV